MPLGITWTKYDQDVCRRIAPLGPIELIIPKAKSPSVGGVGQNEISTMNDTNIS